MAKKKETIPADEQGYLIDIHPENEKEIIKAARAYKQAVQTRQKASEKEVKLKNELLDLVKAAELQPTEDGKIKFSLDGFKISVTPRDMLIQVKCEDEAA